MAHSPREAKELTPVHLRLLTHDSGVVRLEIILDDDSIGFIDLKPEQAVDVGRSIQQAAEHLQGHLERN